MGHDQTDKMQKMLKAIYEEAAGPHNIRKYELRELRGIIEELGGAAVLTHRREAASAMFIASVLPTLGASFATSTSRTPVGSMSVRAAMASMSGFAPVSP